jgi:hypothetical protein
LPAAARPNCDRERIGNVGKINLKKLKACCQQLKRSARQKENLQDDQPLGTLQRNKAV